MTAPFSFRHWPEVWPFRSGSQPGPLGRCMVASTDRYASEVGVAVLEAGGNAADAAVATAFALAVVNPEAGNLGGGTFILAHAPDGETMAIDARSRAPAAATADMFLDEHGDLSTTAQFGPRAAAVPGTVRGLWDLHRARGRRPWASLVEPAVRLARGFRVTERLTRAFPPHIVRGLAGVPESARIFLPEGAPPRIGSTFRQFDLAATLERIAEGGPDGFYLGRTADLVAEAMAREGGVLARDDLAGYAAMTREPISFEYRDHRVLSMPPASSGGVALAEIAHMLADRDVGGMPWHGDAHVHLLAEAWKRAFADRNHYLADADFAPVPVAELVAPAYGRLRGEEIGEHATSAERIGPWAAADEGVHTTHLSVVDGEGGAVSLTTTLNTWYGSKWVAAGTGVLFNNEMDDFTTRPGTPNHFGLVQGAANAIAPGKRPLSAMTPTLVLDPKGGLKLVVGAPGGATIITSVFQVISNLIDHGMGLATAVAAPRVHHQHLPDHIAVEPTGLPAGVVRALRERGHEVVERTEPWGDVQAVLLHADGRREGAADPRRGGMAIGSG